MSKRTIVVVIVVLMLLVGGTVWAIRGRADPQVLKVQQLRQELFSGQRPPDREKIEEFRREMQQLSPEQRKEVGRAMRRAMYQERERRMNKRIAHYFSLPPEKRIEYLDHQIQEMEKRREEMEKRRQEWEARRRQSGQGQGSRRPGMRGQNPNATGQRPSSAGPGRRGNPQNRTPEARSARRNQRLDRRPPLQRAQWSIYFQALRQRRAELGLPPLGRRR